jgi:hypothetical protein
MMSCILSVITLSRPLKDNRRFGGATRLSLLGRRVDKERTKPEPCSKQHLKFFALMSCCDYNSTLKMEMIFSSETFVDFNLTTWCYIPEDN